MRSLPPPELKRVQKGLYQVFTEPRGARAAAAEHPEVVSSIFEAPPIDRETRLSVYGDAYFLRLLEALGSDYAAVRRALGERVFRMLAAAYVAAHPPTSPSLADFGELFPAFVARHRFGCQKPFLADLARLERAALTALLTDRLAPLDSAAFRALGPEDWDRARLVFDPTVRLLTLGWPVAGLWRRRDAPWDARGRGVRRPRAQRLVVWRDDVWVRVRELEAAESTLLRGALEGLRLKTLFSLCDGQLGSDAVRRWFASWLADGLIKEILPE